MAQVLFALPVVTFENLHLPLTLYHLCQRCCHVPLFSLLACVSRGCWCLAAASDIPAVAGIAAWGTSATSGVSWLSDSTAAGGEGGGGGGGEGSWVARLLGASAVSGVV